MVLLMMVVMFYLAVESGCNQRGVNDFITSIKEALGGLAREGKAEHPRQRWGTKESPKAKRTVYTLRVLYQFRAWVVWPDLVIIKDADTCVLGSLTTKAEAPTSRVSFRGPCCRRGGEEPAA